MTIYLAISILVRMLLILAVKLPDTELLWYDGSLIPPGHSLASNILGIRSVELELLCSGNRNGYRALRLEQQLIAR